MELNAQDLFLRLSYRVAPKDLKGLTEDQWQQLGAGEAPLKPLRRLFGLAQAFDDVDPDIVMLCEVGGEESLREFNRLFLGGDYDTYFVPGNSDRGIECGFLVHRDLGLHVEIESHRDVPVDFLYPHERNPGAMPEVVARAGLIPLPPRGKRRLSRDVPELRLYRASAPKAEKPGLILLMTHLKSAVDPDGIDPGGIARRTAELRAILNVREAIAKRHGPSVPIVLAGDMNGHASRIDTASAFTPVYRETDLKDALELAGRALPDRMTHITFAPGVTNASQLDYVLLPKALHERVVSEETYVYRYCYDGEWDERPIPTCLKERAALPSDHYPLVCTLDVDALG